MSEQTSHRRGESATNTLRAGLAGGVAAGIACFAVLLPPPGSIEGSPLDEQIKSAVACDNPGPNEQMLVDNLLGTYVEPTADMGNGYGRIDSKNTIYMSRFDLAASLDLQLMDSSAVAKSLESRFNKNRPSLPVLYEQFNDMLEPTTVQFARDPSMKNVEPVDEYEALASVYEALRGLPVEAVRDSGTKRITMTEPRETDPVSRMKTIGWVDDKHGMFLTPVGDVANTTYHEFWHLWDKQMCPTGKQYWNDYAYARINPGAEGFYTNPSDMKSVINLETYREEVNEKRLYAKNDLDSVIIPEKTFPLDKSLSSINVVSSYSGTNIGEDRAETGGWLLDYSKSDLLFNELSPKISAKAKLLAGRIAVRDPRLAAYFLESRILYPEVVHRTYPGNPMSTSEARLLSSRVGNILQVADNVVSSQFAKK